MDTLLFPHTASRRIVLRPATATEQAGFFQTLLRTGLESIRPAAPPSKARLRMCNAAFVVARRNTDEVLGFSTLHGLDPAGHIRSGVYLDPERARLGIGTEAIHLSTNFAFATFNIDKLIAQTTEASFGAFGLALDDGQKEGVLHDHLYFRGRLWDLHTFRIERRDWESYVDESLDGVLPPPQCWRKAPQ
jgi:hypothetical protein